MISLKVINKKGFTLVELLASLVILGVIMAVAVPNVVGILNRNRASTYIEDAKKLSTTAEYKFRSDNTLQKPTTNGQCIAISLKYLDNSEFNNPPYGGKYLEQESFVIMKKENNSYKYYVQLIEEMPNGSKGWRGISLASTDTLYEDNYEEKIINFSKSHDIANLGKDNSSKVQTYINSKGTGCSSILKVYTVAI